jgi:pimeloyl-ACP methyl ester carboxylesterase
VLVGHSLGGLFAIYVAQQLGDVIHKLIFVNTGLAPKRVAMKAMQQMQINRISKFIKKIGMRMLFSGKLPKWLTRSLYFTDDTPEHIKMELSKHKVRENRAFLMEHFNSKSIWNSHLERIHFSGPDNVLSVFGNKDKTTPKRAFMYLVKKLNASYSIYQGSGHNDIITAPKYNDKFVEEIILFADNV